MVGFFEYQYLSFKKNHLNNMVALAAVDGHIHEDEIKFLYKIGKKYRLKASQIEHILKNWEDVNPRIPDQHHQKVALLYDLVGMMLADNVIEDSEMDFCKRMFRRFGYKETLIDEMIQLYQKKIDDVDEWEEFLEKAEAFRMNLASW
jgi:uncharacterized tellurite resistance protein B-like protein